MCAKHVSTKPDDGGANKTPETYRKNKNGVNRQKTSNAHAIDDTHQSFPCIKTRARSDQTTFLVS